MAFFYFYLAVRYAGVVDVARSVAARSAVNSFVFAYFKKVLAAT